MAKHKRTLELKDLAAGESYDLQVRAINEEIGLPSNWSLTLNFTTDKDTQGPGTVQSVTLVAKARAFQATWNALTLDGDNSPLEDLKDYKVVWSETSNGTNQFIQYTQGTTLTLSYEQNVEELGGVEDVTVSVYGRDHANLESATPGTDAVTNIAANTFTGLVADNESSGSQAISISWPQPTGAAPDGSDNGDDISYYEVYRDRGTNPTPISTITFSPGTTIYVDSDPRPGTHTYEVDAVDVFGNVKTSNSDTATPIYADVADDPIGPNPPTNLVLTPGAPVDDPDGSLAYIDVAFDGPTTDTDASAYDDNEGFIIRWGVNGDPETFDRFINDLRTDTATDPTGFEVRINELTAGTTYDVSVAAFDTNNNQSTFITASALTASDGNAPNTPSAPVVSGSVQALLVSHDLLDNLAAPLARDVAKLEVYAETTNGAFTPDTVNQTNMLGTMQVVGTIPPVEKFPVPAEEDGADTGSAKTWYVKVRAIDHTGNASNFSVAATSTADLITSANIGNATIGTAKISEISAEKLDAGSAFIGDLFVQSTFTMNNGGIMQSDNWDGINPTGWQLTQNGLTIHDGTIEATTLTIQEQNLVAYPYATFPNYQRWYWTNAWTTGGGQQAELDVVATWKRYGYQSLEWSASAATDKLWLGTTNTDYNIALDPLGSYIYSVYVYNPGGSPITVRAIHKTDDAVEVPGDDVVIAAGDYARLSQFFTISGAINSMLVGVENRSGAAAVMNLDGVMVEKVAATSVGTPSIFAMPGGTTISGESITTGSLESFNYDGLGTGWKIDTQGNAEFNNIFARGAIEAVSGELIDLDISGTLDMLGTGLIRTATSGSRIELQDTGLTFYGTDGTTPVITMDATTGDATFAGNITATGGDITGLLTVTGAQGRIEIDTAGFRVYDDAGAGSEVVNINIANNTSTFRGAVKIVEADALANTNLIPTADATGSTGLVDDGVTSPATKYKDGVYSSNSGYSNINASQTGNEDSYFEFDFGEVKSVAELRVYWYYPALRSYQYKVKYSENGTDWYYAVGSAGTGGWMQSVKVNSTVHPSTEFVPTVDKFNPRLTARYIRIYGNGNNVNVGNHVYEIEAFTTYPTDSALSVGENFAVDTLGNMYANNAYLDGILDARGGNIRGSLILQDPDNASANINLEIDSGIANEWLRIGNDVVPANPTGFSGINLNSNSTDTDGSNSDNTWVVRNDGGRIVFKVGEPTKYIKYDSTAGTTLEVKGDITADTGSLGDLDITGVVSIGSGSSQFGTGLVIFNGSGDVSGSLTTSGASFGSLDAGGTTLGQTTIESGLTVQNDIATLYAMQYQNNPTGLVTNTAADDPPEAYPMGQSMLSISSAPAGGPGEWPTGTGIVITYRWIDGGGWRTYQEVYQKSGIYKWRRAQVADNGTGSDWSSWWRHSSWTDVGGAPGSSSTKVKTYNLIDSDSYRAYYGSWRNGQDVYQDSWGFGDHVGVMLFNSNSGANNISGDFTSITKVRIQMQRANSGGYSAARAPKFHRYTSSNITTVNAESYIANGTTSSVSFAWGDRKWVDITGIPNLTSTLNSGTTRGIAIANELNNDTDQDNNYMIFDVSAFSPVLEVTGTGP